MREPLKAGFVTLFLSLGFEASAVAGPLEDGVAAYNNYDFATALKTFVH